MDLAALAKLVKKYDDPPYTSPIVTGIDVAYSKDIAAGCAVVSEKKPNCVSIGHRVSLDTAVRIARESNIGGYPKVLRQAHMISKDALKRYRD